MALVSIRSVSRLASPSILAPERYDPRRELHLNGIEVVELGDIIQSVRKMIKPAPSLGKCFVLDTSDANEGLIVCRKQSVNGEEIGSTKKEVNPGDVIISRLRPYLRQVAFIDSKIPNSYQTCILCSTEFFVLRSIDEKSIAFLVPFLLSDKVQNVLSASQEGGHHPRFIESTLLTLPVPKELINEREKISELIEESVYLYRKSEACIANAVMDVEQLFEGS